jgi:hypothetical protein
MVGQVQSKALSHPATVVAGRFRRQNEPAQAHTLANTVAAQRPDLADIGRGRKTVAQELEWVIDGGKKKSAVAISACSPWSG